MAKSEKDKQQLVIAELRKHGNQARAAKSVGINRRTIWVWRNNDSVFKAATDAAIREFNA